LEIDVVGADVVGFCVVGADVDVVGAYSSEAHVA